MPDGADVAPGWERWPRGGPLVEAVDVVTLTPADFPSAGKGNQGYSGADHGRRRWE
jgi:hypothetical protein